MQTRNTRAPAGSGGVPTDVRDAVEDAVWAPSVHNTQPWRFGVRGTRISLHADAGRRLDVVDPAGRELLISCGAALYTLRLALRVRGYGFLVRPLPVPGRPTLLAEIDVEPGAGPAGDEVVREHAQVRRRRSHRGGFGPEPVPAEAVAALRHAAGQEGAGLVRLGDTGDETAVAALSNAAEQIQRRLPDYAAEIARWAPPPGAPRRDGVPPAAYPRHAPRTAPHFPSRDFAGGRDWGAEPADGGGTARAGDAVLLTTPGDTAVDRLRAGQALQRMLLRAAGYGLAAAFHTQSLQVPELRTVLRLRFCDGGHPQMLLRLGVPEGGAPHSVRRPVEDVLTEEA
ncbi:MULTISPECIES: Acg family FMN-binding oxidoreductase [Actinomadura]|uniref:Acg family FMN-binding oxidoreductase n=1 Tax=Actinomadura TaxID=1988 RepID=UPI000479C237|nr:MULTISPECIES: hypothetical protein [Actinomadura]RSN53396.1 hypothetical protein DMH08_27590 [Actinomadura sp. WAC 06369]